MRLKSFRINKTLKLHTCLRFYFSSLKSFRINKTLKRSPSNFAHVYCLKSFRINKTSNDTEIIANGPAV